MVELEDCILNLFSYHVELPTDDSSPPLDTDVFFRIIFFCNGQTFTSSVFNDADSALAWAEIELSEFGTWSLDENDLIVTGTMCDHGKLYYQVAASLFVYGCTNPAASNYDPLATIDDDSCEFDSSDVVFDTSNQIVAGTKIGGNIFESDLPKLPAWTPAAIDLNFQTHYYTPGSPSMNEANATILNTFLTAVNADVALFYPIQSSSVAAAFPTFLDWLVARFSPVLIQLDQESQNGTTLTNAVYISRSQQVIYHIPQIKTSWDTAPIWKNNPASVQRNLAIKPLTNPDYGRQYEQISPDAIVFSATNNDYNLALLNDYFNNILPGYIAAFFALLTNIRKEVILQWHNNDAGTTALSDALDNYAIGEMARVTLQNTDKFAYLFFMKLGNLISGATPRAPYYSMKLISSLFRFTYSIPCSIPIDGCSSQGFSNGGNSYCILINNQQSGTHTIAPSDIVIPAKTVSGNFTRNSVWATGWGAAIQRDDNISEASITVRPYSVNVITFTVV